MKAIWSTNEDFDTCPECDCVFITVANQMLCPSCAIREINYLWEVIEEVLPECWDTPKAERILREALSSKEE